MGENITVFVARNVIVIGSSGSNSSQDPLARLSSALTTLELQNVVLSASATIPTSRSYTPNWDQLFASKPDLAELTLDNVGLTGTLPSYLPPTVSKFVASNNRISGALPSALLANATSTEQLVLNLANNRLSGQISADFVHALKANVANFYLDLSSNAFSGTIPAALFDNVSLSNAVIVEIALSNNLMIGPIPAGLFGSSFSAVDTLSVNLSSNALSSSIPANLFASISSADLRSLSFDVSANQLSGSIPSFLSTLAHPESLSDATFILSKNGLSGSLPTGIAGNSSFTSIDSLEWRVDSNKLTGTIPAGLFAPSTSSLGDLIFYAQNNALYGSVPSALLSGPDFDTLNAVRISFASNSLNVSLNTALLTDLNDNLNDITLDLSSNPLGGSITAAFLTPFTVDSDADVRVLNLNLANCSLTGTIPADVFGSLTSLDLNLDNNKLTGAYSFSNFLIRAGSNPYSYITFSAAGNQLSGQVYLPGLDAELVLFLNVSSNYLTNLSVDSNVTYVQSIDLSKNFNLTGSVPDIFLSVNASLQVLKAAHTNLSGAFPNAASDDESGLETLDLSYTAIEFCGASRPAWTSTILSDCLLLNTTASACATSYPTVCNTSSVAPPTTPAVPSAPSMPAGPVKPPTADASRIASPWFIAALLVSISMIQLFF